MHFVIVIAPLLLSVAWYAAGVARLWSRPGGWRGLSPWSVAAFAAGWLTAAVALLPPIASLSEILFSVHMTQHTLLMLVAAPLMAFGRPLLVFLWAFGSDRREGIARRIRRPAFAAAWRWLTAPLSAFVLQAIALWIWHLPTLYQAAVADAGIHALQHLSFGGSASLFWWAMVHGRYGRQGYGLAVVYVFLTAIHSGALGALLTVSPTPWYQHYVRQGAAWHVDALADQQLAGLLMWVPAGVVFIVLGLALFAAWLGEAERRVRFGATDAASRPLLVLLAAAVLVSACNARVTEEAETLTGGNVHRGKAAIAKYGCGACHTIPGIDRAHATVGPPLAAIAQRHYLGGHLVNTPGNMIRWIQFPQQADPGNAMPNLGVTDQEARDIAAFLFTLR